MSCICRICSRSVVKASFIALTYSQILKFITFTFEVKRRLWSASHPEIVLQRSSPFCSFTWAEREWIAYAIRYGPNIYAYSHLFSVTMNCMSVFLLLRWIVRCLRQCCIGLSLGSLFLIRRIACDRF